MTGTPIAVDIEDRDNTLSPIRIPFSTLVLNVSPEWFDQDIPNVRVYSENVEIERCTLPAYDPERKRPRCGNLEFVFAKGQVWDLRAKMDEDVQVLGGLSMDDMQKDLEDWANDANVPKSTKMLDLTTVSALLKKQKGPRKKKIAKAAEEKQEQNKIVKAPEVLDISSHLAADLDEALNANELQPDQKSEERKTPEPKKRIAPKRSGLVIAPILEFQDWRMLDPPNIPADYKFPFPVQFRSDMHIKEIVISLVKSYFEMDIAFHVVARCIPINKAVLDDVKIRSNQIETFIKTYTQSNEDEDVIVAQTQYEPIDLRLNFRTRTITYKLANESQFKAIQNARLVYGRSSDPFHIPDHFQCADLRAEPMQAPFPWERALKHAFQSRVKAIDPVAAHPSSRNQTRYVDMITLFDVETPNACVVPFIDTYKFGTTSLDRQLWAYQEFFRLSDAQYEKAKGAYEEYLRQPNAQNQHAKIRYLEARNARGQKLGDVLWESRKLEQAKKAFIDRVTQSWRRISVLDVSQDLESLWAEQTSNQKELWYYLSKKIKLANYDKMSFCGFLRTVDTSGRCDDFLRTMCEGP